jgi:hypothetical protein
LASKTLSSSQRESKASDPSPLCTVGLGFYG